jgi:fatty acyl-CoA reductase
MPGMGLSSSDRRLLTEDVSLVFHGAATVSFDEKLRLAVTINVLGTQNVLELAKDMKKLKVSVRTSISSSPNREVQVYGFV